MKARIGAVAEKIMQVLSCYNGPISIEEVHHQLAEPIGLFHLGVDKLVGEQQVEIVTQNFRNYLKPLNVARDASAPVKTPPELILA